MEKEGLPLGFGFALAQNPDAMKCFSNLSDAKQKDVLQKAHTLSSKEKMESLVNSLSAKS